MKRKFRLVQVTNTWPLAIRKQKVQLFMSKVRQKYYYNFLRYLIIKRCLASTSCAISAKGQRVLGFAYKTVTSQQELTHETLSGLTFAGLAGIIDPPKESAIQAVKESQEAGISVKMITGDHKDTAQAIGEQVGLKHTKKSLKD